MYSFFFVRFENPLDRPNLLAKEAVIRGVETHYFRGDRGGGGMYRFVLPTNFIAQFQTILNRFNDGTLFCSAFFLSVLPPTLGTPLVVIVNLTKFTSLIVVNLIYISS